MKIGQLLFFNLKLMGSENWLPWLVEITDIDTMNKMVRFCYVENGKLEDPSRSALEEQVKDIL
ncbi:MAG: hypothetical protein H6540_02265 [Bacteroidales bacterium]|nr:hypothetical protein [Bacteroidales bacterium]